MDGTFGDDKMMAVAIHMAERERKNRIEIQETETPPHTTNRPMGISDGDDD